MREAARQHGDRELRDRSRRLSRCVARAFLYDEEKRTAVLEKHGIDLKDIEAVFDLWSIDDFDEDHSDSEERWRRLVLLNGRVLVVIYTEWPEGTRLITAFPAEHDEVALFFETFFGESLD